MSTSPLGGTSPPGLFDNQPIAFVFDPDNIITNIEQQLAPFHSIAHIVQDIQKLNTLLQIKPRKTVVPILIFPNKTQDFVTTFINNHILQQQSIHSNHLFFTNGHQHEIELQNRFTSLLINCYSITDYVHSEIREALSTAFDLTIKFCGRRAKEEKNQGNKGVAFIYEQQYHRYLNIQRTYTTSLINEIDKDDC